MDMNSQNQMPDPMREEPPRAPSRLRRAFSAVRRFGKKIDDPINRVIEKIRQTPFWQEYGYLSLCLILPAVLVFLMYLAKCLHPFGDGCVLVLDLNGQYVWFFEALRNFVRGDASLLYSFSRALGGEFLGIYAYYIASPLSFLVCLFPKDRMLEALLALFMLKASLCGLTFGYYMHKTLKVRRPLAVIAFSTFYALTAYAVIQQHNTMWIDAVMWLPLITLGIESLIKEGKFKLYTISLAIAIFSNFYIGYMLCIYCAIYFFLYYLAHKDAVRNPLGEKAHFIKSLMRMAIFSMIAVGIAAVIIFSAYYALNFGKTTFTDPSWEWEWKFNFVELFIKFMPGSYDTVRPEGLPCLYCGVLTLMLLPFYFASRKYPLRQKLVGGLFILIFFASMLLSVPDLIWHGFQNPNWLNYRYSFMLCFYLCVLACRAFADFELISMRGIFVTGGLVALFAGICWWYSDGEYVDPNEFTCVLFTLAAVLVYIGILMVMKRVTDKQVISAILIGAISVEVFLCGLWNLNDLDMDVGFSRYSYYNDFLDSTRPIVEEVQAADTSFYRMEKTKFRKVNDNMALGIRGLSGSTSTLNYETVRFLNKMGYSSSSHWSKYLGGNPVNDSLLGIKYIVSEEPVYANYYDIFTSDPENLLIAYQNPYALSIAYGVDDAILKFPLGYVETSTQNPNMAQGDNTDGSDGELEESRISAAISALKAAINARLGIEETVNDAEYVDAYDNPFDRLNAMVTAMLGEEKTVKIFVPISRNVNFNNVNMHYVVGHYSYSPADASKDAVISYTVKMPTDAELFFYDPSEYPREVGMTLHDEGQELDLDTFNGNESTRIISLGWQTAGESLKLDLKLMEDHYYPMLKQDSFYYINWSVFEDAMARLATDQYQITDFDETSFTGHFTPSRDNELVLTTIAYDKGWKVLLDGEEVEITKALGSLIAFRIDGAAGETHTVEMRYEPATFHIGLTVSLVSLGILALLILSERKLKRIPLLRAIVSVPTSDHGATK